MIAALICVISVAALVQFFVSYTRSLVAAYRKVEISAQVREVAGLSNQGMEGDDFMRLLQLVRMCPEQGDDGFEIRTVGIYYSFLNVSRKLLHSFRDLAAWIEQEREHCAYFAAVALDRRIAYNRYLVQEQMPDYRS
jgi:hypothetical protein